MTDEFELPSLDFPTPSPPLSEDTGYILTVGQICGAITLCFSILIFFSFFVAPWMRFTDERIADGLTDYINDSELAKENDISPFMVTMWMSMAGPAGIDCNLTAFQLVSGSLTQCDDDAEDTVALNSEYDRELRTIEYSVILLPIVALTGVILGFVAFQSKNFSQYIPLMIVGGFLAFYPSIWEQMYNYEVKNWMNESLNSSSMGLLTGDNKDALKFIEGLTVALIETANNTTLFTVSGLLILIAGFVGFLLGDDPQMGIRIPNAPKSAPPESPFS